MELHRVLEALKSATVEIAGLIDEDIYVPSGDLLEQLEEACLIVNGDYERECDGTNNDGELNAYQ